MKRKLFFILAVPVASVFGAFLIASLFILVLGKSPAEVFVQLFRGTIYSSYGLGQVLFKATPLIFTGLAVAFALKAGLFNIGAEGQLYMGSFVTAWIGFTFTIIYFCSLANNILYADFDKGGRC